mmetsp:Transcript_781/g.1802  ORF Transcript_781/g.1802 Transcript_781/m.1802 type:complete len:446 (+) Transcript_781:1463-2800(+)
MGTAEGTLSHTTELGIGSIIGITPRSIKRKFFTIVQNGRATIQYTFRSTFQHQQQTVIIRILLSVNAQLILVGTVERNLSQEWICIAHLNDITDRLTKFDERTFGSITKGGTLQNWNVLLVRLEGGVVAEAHDAEQRAERDRILVKTAVGKRRIGRNNLVVVPHMCNSHAVLGQSTGLVGTNSTGGAQGLYRFQVLHQYLLLGHALRSQGQRHSHGGQQTFWHICDNNTNHKEQIGDDIIGTKTKDEEDETKRQSQRTDNVNEMVDFLVNRSLLVASSGSQTGDAANHSGVTAQHHDASGTTLGGTGTVEGEVTRLHGALVGHLVGTSLRLRLTGERRVVDLETVALDDAQIGRDLVTATHLDQVTQHQVGGVDLDLGTVANDERSLRHHVCKAGHHGGTLTILVVGEDTRDGDDGHEHDTQVEVLRSVRVDRIADERQDGTHPQ